MIKNNVLSLVYQVLLSLLFFLLIWFTKDDKTLLRFLFGTFAGKALICLLVLALYQVFGRLLSTRGIWDLFTSSLALILLGGLCLVLAYSGLDQQIFTMEPAQSLRNLPYTLITMPYITILKMCHVPLDLATAIMGVFFGPILFSISQGLYLIRRKKRRENQPGLGKI